MCTVIYLPTQFGCLFSSNRDESPMRSLAKKPVISQGQHFDLLYPQDTSGGGTWAGVNSKGNIIILLNGAFIKHTRQISYRKSRGLIVKELLDEDAPVESWLNTDLQNVESFTLIVWSNMLYELVWDGENKIIQTYSIDQPHIWSSSTLYNTEVKALRTRWFTEWLQKDPEITADSVRNLLLSHTDPDNGFVMNRNEIVKTLSISTIELKALTAIFQYYELATEELTTHQINLTEANNTSESVKKVVSGKTH